MIFFKAVIFTLKNFFLALRNLYFDFFFVPFDPNKPLPKDSIYLLNEIVDILEKLKINYFLTDGTILGLYRDQKFIEHDNDIDIALIDNKKILSLYIRLLKSGWIPMRILIKNFHVYQLIFHKREIVLDFCNWKKKGKQIFFQAPEINGYRLQDKRFYKPTRFFINEIKFYSHSFLEDWLRIHYGEDWHIPKTKKGDWREDTNDIRRFK